mgnify:CR=1 FL=1
MSTCAHCRKVRMMYDEADQRKDTLEKHLLVIIDNDALCAYLNYIAALIRTTPPSVILRALHTRGVIFSWLAIHSTDEELCDAFELAVVNKDIRATVILMRSSKNTAPYLHIAVRHFEYNAVYMLLNNGSVPTTGVIYDMIERYLQTRHVDDLNMLSFLVVAKSSSSCRASITEQYDGLLSRAEVDEVIDYAMNWVPK